MPGSCQKKDDFKQIWIRRDLSEEERKKMNDMLNQANAKNGEGTEEEKKKFYWKAVDMKLKKWFAGNRERHLKS